MLSLFALLLVGAIHVQAAQFTLHHRVFHPLLPTAVPYAPRATLEVSGNNVHLESVSTVPEDLALFAEKLNPTADISQALYQVALERPGDTSHTEWAVSSVKLCYLSSATSQTLFLYISEEDSPYAINYFLSPVAHRGSCTADPSLSPLQAFSERISYLNTTILLRRPSTPPAPELKASPPLTPEGQVIQPVPEKSFLQKYWMYISIFLIAIIFTGGGPEESGRPAA